MFTINQDYFIKNSDIPVLTRQADGHFEHTNCYFLEFVVNADDETIKKIKTLSAPFGFCTAITQAASTTPKERLFLLGGTDIIKNSFNEPDDFLAIALCLDEPKSTIIQYFETNSKYRHSYEPNQKYRYVGTSGVKALQKVYHNRKLCGISAFHALGFWFKNGFSRIDDRERYLHWYQR